MVHLSGWKSEQLMYVDESAANEHTMDRKYGWASIGIPARLTETLTNGVFFQYIQRMDILHGMSAVFAISNKRIKNKGSWRMLRRQIRNFVLGYL